MNRERSLLSIKNGGSYVAGRIAGQEGTAAVDFAQTTQFRVTGQQASPKTGTAIRRLVSGIAAGDPNYDEMAPPFAQLIRTQLPNLKTEMNQLGRIESMTFKRAEKAGQDVYDVVFEHSAKEFEIAMGPDDRILGAGWDP